MARVTESPEMLARHFELARRHVAKGEFLCRQQRARLERLERDGPHRAAATARDLLNEMERIQAVFIDHRQRIEEMISGEEDRQRRSKWEACEGNAAAQLARRTG